MHGLKSIFSIILAFATYMCEPDPASDLESSCQTNNSNNEPDGGLTCGESFDLSNGQGGPGVFAAKVSQYVHVNSAGIVETDTMSKLFLKIEYHVNEDPMFALVEICRLEIPAVEIPGQPNPAKMTLRPSLFANADKTEVPLTQDGDTTCSTVSTAPAPILFGIRLQDEMNDNVPKNADNLCPDGGVERFQSPCIYDMDEDGEPGVTLDAQNIPGIEVTQVFMAMRSWTSTSGLVANSDLILGEADWGLEQYAIGCKLIPVGASEERYCTNEEKEVVDNVNPVLGPIEDTPASFMGVRIAPEMSCTEILENELELFGR
ncbi:MAG: hypothetical protein ACQES9_11120 [Myxococcota bacterium]